MERYSQRPYLPPPGATELIVLRHGASATAVPGEPFPLVEGQSDPPLAPAGVLQARLAAERLAEERPAGVFITPLRRTAETAVPLAELTGHEPVVVPDLREIHVGELEGGLFRISVEDGDELIKRLLAEERWEVIPGAETSEALGRRVRAGAERVVAAVGPDAAAVVVTHGGVIAELCRQATGSRPFAFLRADNTSITRIVITADGSWLLRSFNDSAHLGVAAGDPPSHPRP